MICCSYLPHDTFLFSAAPSDVPAVVAAVPNVAYAGALQPTQKWYPRRRVPARPSGGTRVLEGYSEGTRGALEGVRRTSRISAGVFRPIPHRGTQRSTRAEGANPGTHRVPCCTFVVPVRGTRGSGRGYRAVLEGYSKGTLQVCRAFTRVPAHMAVAQPHGRRGARRPDRGAHSTAEYRRVPPHSAALEVRACTLLCKHTAWYHGLQHGTLRYGTLQHGTLQHGTVHNGTVRCRWSWWQRG